MAARKVLVVGATGFLGKQIVQQLLKESNVVVKAMSRKGAPAGQAAGPEEWVKGDLMQPDSLDAALAGVDVVVSSANGYMKETIKTDFEGNKNLIEAAARAKVKRFVFLSIVACDKAPEVPHFHAKKVAEDLIKAAGLPYVFVRAPAFLDQSTDWNAENIKSGRFLAIGDMTTKWSYVFSEDLAKDLAKAAAYPGNDIDNVTMDVGWKDGPVNNAELRVHLSAVSGKSLSAWTLPWFLFSALSKPIYYVSELGYDLLAMFLFFRKGQFVADTTAHDKFLGPSPLAADAIARWAAAQGVAAP